MSYCEMMKVQTDGTVCGVKEYRNAYGFSAFVWSALVSKYRKLLYPNDPLMMPVVRMFDEEWRDLWDNAKTIGLRHWEWIALQFTYDRVIVRKADIPALADALERLSDALATRQVVNHLPALACDLRELAKSDGVLGACMYGMSVSENLWIVYEGEDGDGRRPYDINRDEGHRFLDPTPLPDPA